jgi:hypothetical protein
MPSTAPATSVALVSPFDSVCVHLTPFQPLPASLANTFLPHFSLPTPSCLTCTSASMPGLIKAAKKKQQELDKAAAAAAAAARVGLRGYG